MKAPTPSPVQDPSERIPSSTRKASKSILGIFSSTFITIFLAEMGDKTQLTTLLMTAESDAPWVVFLGAALALITTSLIGVLLGRWLANRVAEDTIETFAAVILLFIAILLLGEMVSL